MNVVFKLLAAGISFGAGFAANKLVDTLWTKATGNEPPKDGDNLEHSLRSALTFAVVSSTVAAIIQTLTGRGAQRAISRFDKTRDLT
ncbi:DUF4235 domain-containing protein [Acaricomes phytoseiuli]|uniref:DUF4235 domain-containing protein n=1 Tax=Acaricomes phytoseiuli TaxID=291968 RepID=UPI00035FAACF|nr:DUF4235 domain-containing protein [Acaricomes phytoseiuli]MCW1248906.1 DUF4235 domain-containing protein [Acaricomes phytoseiuli]